ncbi:MAG: 6-carboxyhexanoate--CoA ligase [Paraclostridium sp.]|uniref:6-carboxyhexanoate--CoA ligase n=1 Tax=Paraclostridium sp. TaxID=2023273 RepID=UPI003F345258
MNLYSIKMRSSKSIKGISKHISGAESIVNEADLEKAVNLLIRRALNHTKGKANSINIKLEEVDKESIKYIDPIPVTTINVKNHLDGFKAVKKMLLNLGINEKKSNYIINLIKVNSNMRGAILLDINTFERLEKDKERGIRATYMDFEGSDINSLTKQSKNNAHFIEALTLASKVISCNEIIGELCYSDDPEYTAGYLASKKYGYVRFTHLKEVGDNTGGRIFLYDSSKENIDRCINYLQNQKVIIKNDLKINEDIDYEDYINDKQIIKLR